MLGFYLKSATCTNDNERLESNHPPFGFKSLDFKLYIESVARVRPNVFLKEIQTKGFPWLSQLHSSEPSDLCNLKSQ